MSVVEVARPDLALSLLEVRVATNDPVGVLRQVGKTLGVSGLAAWGATCGPGAARKAFSFATDGDDVGAPERELWIWRHGESAPQPMELEDLADYFRPEAPAGAQELRSSARSTGGLLSWVSAFQPEPFTPRQRAVFSALSPTIHRRLAAEHELSASGAANSLLAAALDAIPGPTFVIDDAGNVLRANRAGVEMVALNQAALAAELANALMGSSQKLRLTRVPASDGGLGYSLVTISMPASDPAARLAQASARWGLTRRQTEVLARLVLGESNKTIAARLQCADNTIELHVTRLLSVAGVDCRSALVAAFWRM